MLVRVKKGCRGFWKGERKRAGQSFELAEGDAFSPRWMEEVEAEKPKLEPKKTTTRKARTSKVTKVDS